MMSHLCFEPKKFDHRYVYYSPSVIAPFFPEIEATGKTKIQHIIEHTVDLGRLSTTNEYYNRYAPEYINTYTDYFGSREYECTKLEYYKFFQQLANHSVGEYCRSSKLIREDMSLIKAHGLEHIDDLVEHDSELVYEDDRYTVRVPYTYDALRVLLGRTYSCFASESTECMKGYFNVGSICYIINDNKPVFKNLDCVMNLISQEIEADMWINSYGSHLLYNKHYYPLENGYPSENPVTFLSVENVLQDGMQKCKDHINHHYNNTHSSFHISTKINTDKGLFCNADVKKRWEDNLYMIQSSHNTDIQRILYDKILDKFSRLQSPEVFSKIKKEFEQFNDTYFASVPTDDVQIHKLWRFWPISKSLDNIIINGKKHSSVDFFRKTYDAVTQEDNTTDHQGVLGMGISVLRPDCTLNAHTGYHNNMPHNCVFRMHLPLSVPVIDKKPAGFDLCGLKLYENIDEPGYGQPVTKATRHIEWREGQLLVFDDSFKHEAWNITNQPRAILMIDYIDDNMIVNKFTGRSPLTNNIESVKDLAIGWHKFFIDELNNKNYINEYINKV
jgi:hypothetical protein